MPVSRNSNNMKNIFLSLIASLSFSIPALAQQSHRNYLYANAFRHEIEASTTYGELSSASSLTILQLSGTYKYMFAKAMQAGFKADVLMTSGSGNNHSYLGLWGIFVYNFNHSWNNSDSYFGEFGAGLVDTALAGNRTSSATATSDKKFSYLAMAGKNFPLWERIKYSPKAGIRKIGDTDMQILLIPINLTIAF